MNKRRTLASKMIQPAAFMRMQLTVMLVLFFILQAGASSLAQPYLTLSRKNVTLKEVFDEIKKQTDLTVFYSADRVNDGQTIHVDFRQADVQEVLAEILKGQPLTYVIRKNTIVIKEAPLRQQISARDGQANAMVQNAVSGRVVDANGVPLESVSVTVRSTRLSAVTTASGSYNIVAQPDDVLVFSSVGFTTKEEPVRNRTVIDVVLEQAISDLDEVLVVAFGTAKKSTYTGSAATIGTETFENRPITEISQALAGSTPGLQVGTSNGQPGSEPTIRIRGIGSFNAGNAPLIILDGMPYDNAFSSINPTDVETVTVLKDASSAALYGARGANGVLLITTKKGRAGRSSVVGKYNFGLTSRQSSDYERLGDKDYMEYYWEMHRNGFLTNGMDVSEANNLAGPALLAGLSYNPFLIPADELFDSEGRLNPTARNYWADDTDWYGAITQVGKRHDASLSISGGNQSTDYYTSVGYMNEEGFVIGSEFERISARSNINSRVTDWLKVGANTNLSHSTAEGEQTETSGAISNPFRATRYLGNIFPIHLHNPATGEYILDSDGKKIPDFGTGWTSEDGSIVIAGRDAFSNSNHPAEVHNINRGYLRQTINIKGYADATLLPNLVLTVNGGLGSNMYRSWNGGFVYEQKGNAGSSSKNTSNTTTWTFQQLLNYDKSWGLHTISALAGHESYQYSYHYMSTSMQNQSVLGNNFEYANFTEINALPNSYTHNYRVEGYLSRLSYDYDEKYFASASYRKDGSSRFSSKARWGDFWSVGAGWALEKEPFMDHVDVVNVLKLRTSYGVVGNDDLSSYYPWRATYRPADNGEPGYVQATLGNADLSWENSGSFDVAAEFELFDRRLQGTLEYFHRVSSNLLFSVPQPISSGIDNVDVNAGSMYNKGWEISLEGEVVRRKDFSIRINAHTTYLENKISDLPLDPYTSSPYKIEEGHSRYDFWLRQWYGVNPETGLNLFRADTEQFDFADGELKEINGVMYTETLEKSLYGYSGSAIPKAVGGFGAQIGWKDFDLKFNFYYQLGGKFYDNTYSSFMNGSLQYASVHADQLGRWRKPGDQTDIAKVTTASTERTNTAAATSTRWLASSNMLELTNVSLSYKLPARLLGRADLSAASLYFSADNVWLLTAKKGMYPRRSFYSGYIGNSDVYPPSSIVSFGASFTF